MTDARPWIVATLTMAALQLQMGLFAPASGAETPRATKPTPPLRFVQIEKLAQFSGFFNIAQGTVRIVAYLSPSRPDCMESLHEIENVMDSVATRRLRSYVVFAPTHEGDSLGAALKLISGSSDPRSSYFWDPNHSVGEILEALAGTDSPIFDAYFVFDTDAVLRENADTSTVWIHRRGDAGGANRKALETEVRGLLARLAEKRAHAGETEEMPRHRK